MNTKCQPCAEEDLVAGEVFSPMRFRPYDVKNWTLTGTVPVEARVCLRCGRVELTVDVDALESIRK